MEISFSYVITFISLIYGLAIAHALSCSAEYIQRWKEIKQYWVWWFWAIWLLMLSVGFWISFYTFYSKIETWNVSYDDLLFGKPEADVYIDDKANDIFGWFLKN